MGNLPGIGKIIIVFGVLIVLVGIIITFIDKIPILGKLPGDISFKKENLKVYIPIGTSILLSVIATLVLYIINHFFRR